jgi:hypothetical protein
LSASAPRCPLPTIPASTTSKRKHANGVDAIMADNPRLHELIMDKTTYETIKELQDMLDEKATSIDRAFGALLPSADQASNSGSFPSNTSVHLNHEQNYEDIQTQCKEYSNLVLNEWAVIRGLLTNQDKTKPMTKVQETSPPPNTILVVPMQQHHTNHDSFITDAVLKEVAEIKALLMKDGSKSHIGQGLPTLSVQPASPGAPTQRKDHIETMEKPEFLVAANHIDTKIHAPTSIPGHTRAIFDSGTTGHYLLLDTECIDKKLTTKPIVVSLPNGARSWSSISSNPRSKRHL